MPKKLKQVRKFNGKEFGLSGFLPKNKRVVKPIKGTRKRNVEFHVSEVDKDKTKQWHHENGRLVRIVGDRVYTRKKKGKNWFD